MKQAYELSCDKYENQKLFRKVSQWIYYTILDSLEPRKDQAKNQKRQQLWE